MLIAQAANFYGPGSGGLRTTLEELGKGYRQAGHDRLLIVPGPRFDDRVGENGRVVTLAAPALGKTGYRAIVDWRQVAAVLDDAGADRVEVSDKLTLWPLGNWAAARGIPAVLFSHERLDAILAPRVASWVPLGRMADTWNRRLAAAFAGVVCTSAFSRAEWERVGASVHTVALGVDLATFRPSAHRRGGVAEVVCVGRLSREKRPDLAVEALAELVASGVAARLTVVGGGPMHESLTRRARGLPVTFTGHVAERAGIARTMRTADVAIAPCPAETFGLSVIEALACGTPVVTTDQGGAKELLTRWCGMAAPARPTALAAAIAKVLALPPAATRAAARRRAEHFGWGATVDAMLDVHRLPPRVRRPGAA